MFPHLPALAGGNQCQRAGGAEADMAAAAHQPPQHPLNRHTAHHPGIPHQESSLPPLYLECYSMLY